MSERYSRLFTLPENLYAVGSPVVIAAGTLLKDNQTGKIVAQLKLRSISDKVINAVKVSLNLFDTAGKSIGDAVEYDYLDLNQSRDSEFGQKRPIHVSESKARSYMPAITEVVFADRTTWTASNAEWKSLPSQKTLDAVLRDSELVKQYRIAVGSNYSYYPLEERDLWYCTCGALNRQGENCHACGRTLFELQTIDPDQLAKEKDARVAQEKAAAEEKAAAQKAAAEEKAAAQKAAAEAAKKKTAKILKIVIPAVCVVIAFVILLNSVIIPSCKYNNAVALMDAGQYEEAIAAFEAVDGYKDSADMIIACETAILDGKYNEAVALMKAGQYEGAIAAFDALDGYKDSADLIDTCETAILDGKYNDALLLMDKGQYEEAITVFETIDGYKDSTELLSECYYLYATEQKNTGQLSEAALSFGKAGTYLDAEEQSFALWSEIAQRDTISAGYYFAVGLKKDGTVVAAGNNTHGQCNVEDWTDIIAISTGDGHTVGLRADGTVVAVGDNDYGQCDVESWTNIVAISAGGARTVGLRADGTVVAVGNNTDGQCNVEDWTDIVSINAGGHTVGLKADGTVVAVGRNTDGQCNVEDWTDIIAISAGYNHTVGLKADGTVVAVGKNTDGQCFVHGWRWTEINAISAGGSNTVGLKADGTVVYAGSGKGGAGNVGRWSNIIAISTCAGITVGLKADRTVVVSSSNLWGEKNASTWTNIKLPN